MKALADAIALEAAYRFYVVLAVRWYGSEPCSREQWLANIGGAV